MSRSPFFFVERFDKNTKKYEIQHPIIWNYNHTKQEMADLFPYNGHHDLFSIVEKRDDFPHMWGIHQDLPKDVALEIKKAYDDCSYESEYANEKHLYTPTARWFTYADMYIYYLEHPEVLDHDSFDEKVMIPNPIKSLINRVNAFLEVMDEWGWREDYSLIRIVYWIC